MMTILMDNSLDLSSRVRVQRLYSKNVELENRRQRLAQARRPSDPNAWQQMRENYEAIVLEDRAFSEQHEIEYALWQLHYRRIEEFRAHFNAALATTGAATSLKGNDPTQPDQIMKIRSEFKTFLSEATGFYHDLMLKIRVKYGLPLGSCSNDPESQIIVFKSGNNSVGMKKGLISCQRCLIYLGDLSRYKGLYGEGDSKTRDFAAALSYYKQASSLWPASGNPYHQLAILASYSGDELVSIYWYFRSLAVDNPFLTARDNLIIAFEKNRQNFSQLVGDAKALSTKSAAVRVNRRGRGKGNAMSPLKDNKTEACALKKKASRIPEVQKAFGIRFIRLNGILFTRTSLEIFEGVFSMVRSDLLELLSSGPEEEYNFGSSAMDSGLVIVRLISILIFTLHNVNRGTENQSYAEILQRSALLQNAFTAIFEFMGHIVDRCIQLSDPLVSFLLPGVLIFMEWLACYPDFAAGSEVEEKQANARLFFWKNCVSFLNKLLSSGLMPIDVDEDETCFSNMSRYDEGETANRIALWEDFELRGFSPLAIAHLILDFSKQSLASDVGNNEKKARLQRIIAAGKALVSVVQLGQQGVYFDSKVKKFAIGVEPQTVNDFGPAASFEIPASNLLNQEYPAEKTLSMEILQHKAHLDVEGEEEDEVIVFKPSVTDRHADANGLEFCSYEILSTGSHASQSDLTAPLDGFFVPKSFDKRTMCATSPTTVASQHLQSFKPTTSKWLAESELSIVNGLNNMNFVDNGAIVKPGLQERFGVLQPATLSQLLPNSATPSAGNQHSGLVSHAVIPSKFDSILSSGASFDTLAVKPSLALPTRMNPVSQPVRHCGPPPGFCPVPSKIVNESSDISLNGENLQIDDYSWLDGYQKPSSTKATMPTNTISYLAQSYCHTKGGNSLMGTTSFPFPGKQLQPFQGQIESQKGWLGHQIPDHLKLYQDQRQWLHKMRQESIPVPEQYQGQSLWEGRFFV